MKGEPVGTTAAAVSGGSRYRDYMLLVLTVILTFNFLDRMALGVLLQSIKRDLHLSDTELGFLSGLGFALFYAIAGVPIARWADKGDRIKIVAATTAIWSVAVAACGFAASFLQLLAIRVGVAVGEAGCIPPAHSLIADYFTRAERPRAVGRYMLGITVSVTLGYFGAGWLNEFFGWRTTFVVIGLPGMLLGALAWLTLVEPRANTELESKETVQASLSDTVIALHGSRTFRHLLICFSVWYFFGYGLQQWIPTFFIRSHHLTTGELGNWFALIYGLGGGGGILLGGELAARYGAGNERAQLIAGAFTFILFAFLNALAFLARNEYLALILLAIAVTGGNLAQGPILATLQTLVPERMRALAFSIVYLFANLIGMGFGPLSAGVISDALAPRLGSDSLRYALVILCPGYFWAAWHLWRASKTVADDVAKIA